MNVIAQLAIGKLLKPPLLQRLFHLHDLYISSSIRQRTNSKKHDQFVQLVQFVHWGSVVPVHQLKFEFSIKLFFGNASKWFEDEALRDHSCNSPVLFHLLYGNVQDTLPGSFSSKTHKRKLTRNRCFKELWKK